MADLKESVGDQLRHSEVWHEHFHDEDPEKALMRRAVDGGAGLLRWADRGLDEVEDFFETNPKATLLGVGAVFLGLGFWFARR